MVEPPAAGKRLLPIPPSALSPEAICHRFARDAAPWTPEIVSDQASDSPRHVRPAAVLITIIVAQSEPTVLLTVRPAHLRAHAGQIAFPGGAVESYDTDRVATALREAREEVGLQLAPAQVLGKLPVYKTGTGFEVTPVVAMLAEEPALVIDPSEVDQAFEVPLAFLMDPRNHQQHRWGEEPGARVFYAMPWRRDADQTEFYIWGVTAAILRNLYQFLRA